MFGLSLPAFLALLVAFLALGYWVSWRYTHRRMLRLAALVPGPPAWPLIGNAIIFMSSQEELLHVIQKLTQKYGDYLRVWLGPELVICVKDPADIRTLLTSNKVNQKGPLYDIMKEYIGPGILTGGSVWRLHRKLANPSYNKKSVKHYSDVFNQEGKNLATVLSSKRGGTYNVFHDVLDTTTQCVCQTLMGLSKKDSQNVAKMDEFVKGTQDLYSLIFNTMTRWWYQIPLVYRLIGAKKKKDYYLSLIDEMATDIVAKRRKELEGREIMSEEERDDEVMGIVDRYILSGELTEQEIKWETVSLFTTSQEASAKIASAVLLFLAHLQDWQEKVYNEIVEVLGPEDEFIADEDLKKLKHLDMVYKEVLRYLAIAAMIQRTVEEEVTVNNGKITLPAGTSLAIAIHDLHRDPRYWEDPDQVRPDRFLPENIRKRDPNVFVPFSLGPMDCLGRVYATSLIKTIVVRVLRQVFLEADGKLEDLEIHVAISVKFAKGYNLRTRPRKNGINLHSAENGLMMNGNGLMKNGNGLVMNGNGLLKNGHALIRS